MSGSEIASAVVMALIVWGVIGIILKWIGWIGLAWYWIMAPFFAAVVMLIVMLFMAMAQGGAAR